MKRLFISGLIAGVVLFIISYGGMYLTIRFFPELFVEYNNPLFLSDGSKDVFFYSHAFVISIALSVVWERFKNLFKGPAILKGIEFGFVYALLALLPILWITFSSLDITFVMVASWFIYGLFQSVVAGIIFAKLNP